MAARAAAASKRTAKMAEHEIVFIRQCVKRYLPRIAASTKKLNPRHAMSSDHATAPPWSEFLEQTIASFGCVTGTLHRLDPADGHLKLVAHRGIPEALMPVIQSIPVGKGIAGAAAQRKEPVELCNLQTDASGVAKSGAKQTQVQGSLAVPVLDANGRLCGTLGIGKLTPYEFSSDEKWRLVQTAGSIATRLLPDG